MAFKSPEFWDRFTLSLQLTNNAEITKIKDKSTTVPLFTPSPR